MGAMPMHLPWTVIRQWAEAEGMNEAEARFLDACCSAMDDVFLKEHQARDKARAERQGKG